MSNPLDDFNRRMTFGNTFGPPRNAAESAAQSFLDARQPKGTASGGGGGIDLGPHSIKPLAGMLAGGVLLLLGGIYAMGNLTDGAAMLGFVVILVGGLLTILGGVLLLMVGVGTVLGSTSPRQWLLSIAAALVAWWWLTPFLWSIGLPLPPVPVALVVAGLTFLLTKRRR